jgi:hypothetical protein
MGRSAFHAIYDYLSPSSENSLGRPTEDEPDHADDVCDQDPILERADPAGEAEGESAHGFVEVRLRGRKWPVGGPLAYRPKAGAKSSISSSRLPFESSR